MHPAWTYTLHDLGGACWGALAFAAGLLAPGYCLGQLLQPQAFRNCRLREQLAWAVSLSFGPGVLLLVGVVGVGGATAGAVWLGTLSVAALWLARKYPPKRDVSRRHLLFALTVLAAWVCLVLESLVDFGTPGRLWMSVTAYDHGLRTAFVDAVLRTAVPPVDPVYWPGHDVPMRYYYFWYALCASIARLAHISSRQALIASCVWPPVGVVAMLALFGRYMLLRRGRELSRLTAVAAALLAVTGLDLLVTAALHALHTPVLADMEWWSIDQVASWPDTFLWVPHHAAALVAALLGLLLLMAKSVPAPAARSPTRRSQIGAAALAGFCFAAAFGMSAYLAVGAAILAAGWWLASLVHGQGWKAFRNLVVSAVVALLSLCRFLWQLTRHDGPKPGPGRPLYFGIREILSPIVLASSSLFHSLSKSHPWRARELAAAILLLPGWGVELGFYAIALLAATFRVRRKSPAEETLLWLTFCGLFGASFIRSRAIATNDYGIRAALLPQFFLLLIGALLLLTSTGGLRRFLWLLCLIGVGGCAYQLVLLRTYVPLQQSHGAPELRNVGERTFALREAYARLDIQVPSNARIQFDPASTGFYLYPHLLFAHRQMVTAEITCSTSFGGDPAACPALQSELRQLFPTDAASTPDAAEARRLCASMGAQYLVVTRWDGAWKASSSWVWTLPVVVGSPDARVLACVSS